MRIRNLSLYYVICPRRYVTTVVTSTPIHMQQSSNDPTEAIDKARIAEAVARRQETSASAEAEAEFEREREIRQQYALDLVCL